MVKYKLIIPGLLRLIQWPPIRHSVELQDLRLVSVGFGRFYLYKAEMAPAKCSLVLRMFELFN